MLKIDCPYDGSLSTLCKSFFEAIDNLLGTRYSEKFGSGYRVTSTMLLHMTSLASMYGIGLLVIDEIQHLLHSKNDQEEILNFFVTLSNTVGIPTVLIGTSKAQSFTQPITIRAIVKPHASGGTVLRVVSVKNKQIPYKEITYEHPGIAQSTKVNEPKKYTLQTKKNLTGQQDEMILDEEIEGATDEFDVIEMDNQKHEYIEMPKMTKIPRRTNKKREFEDENTKKRIINTDSKRSTADVGGSQVTRGLEQQALVDIQIEGELGEFIKVMQVLQDFPGVQSINIIQGSLKEFSDTKRFVYLSDGVTERKYVIAEVRLFSGKVVNVIEVEREEKAISTFIYFSNKLEDTLYELNAILRGLVDNNGLWDKAQLSYKRINYLTLRHGKKEYRHRATVILNKVIEI